MRLSFCDKFDYFMTDNSNHNKDDNNDYDYYNSKNEKDNEQP